MNTKKRVVIIGAGMGGLTAAAGLKAAGFEVVVFERAQELRWVGSGLSLMSNALSALNSIGIQLDFKNQAVEFDALRFLTKRGHPIRSIDFSKVTSQLGFPNLAIHRAVLQKALLEQANGCDIQLGATATGFQRGTDRSISVNFADGRSISCDVLIGADGFNSAIRAQLAGAKPATDWNYIVWRATPTFSHPAITKGYVAHYWGRGQRFGLADIGGGNVYWWGTKNMPATQIQHWNGGKQGIEEHYRDWSDEVRTAIAATPEGGISSLPAQDRPFLEKWGDGPVTLLGDAAHPMLTSLGQGAAIAIEDGAVLAHCLSSIAEPEAALRTYEDRRRERARAMVEASRALSQVEQREAPFRVMLRDLYFRIAREQTFAERNKLALTFPGVE